MIDDYFVYLYGIFEVKSLTQRDRHGCIVFNA